MQIRLYFVVVAAIRSPSKLASYRACFRMTYVKYMESLEIFNP